MTRRMIILGLMAIIMPAAGVAAPDVAGLSAQTEWTRAAAAPLGIASEPVDPRERDIILDLARNARVLALGEFMHGGHEPLSVRNRWIRLLVEHGAITAVAVESGFAQSRLVNDFIHGGPGDAESVTRQGFTWTFETYRSNLELVRWLRGWNDAHPDRKISFYGADVSGGDEKDGLGRASVVIDELLAYLKVALPGKGAKLDARLRTYAGKFDQLSWSAMSRAETGGFGPLMADLKRAFAHSRREMIVNSDERAYSWALQMIEDAERLAAIFEIWPVANPKDFEAFITVGNLRDRAMADHILWALRQEGSQGKLLSFAANGHATRVGFTYLMPDGSSARAAVMGEHLAASLGKQYRVVLSATSGKVGAPSLSHEVDVVLSGSGTKPYFVSMDNAPHWWRQPRLMTYGELVRTVRVIPADAADAWIFLGPVTDEPIF